MGRKASKATDNIYYMARCNAALSDDAYTSREKTAVRLGIERSRLARIELDKIEPYAEEVLIMARAYNAPYLCEDFCNHICPIGIQKSLKEHQRGDTQDKQETESLERLVLRFLSSTQSIDEISNQLVNITKDGLIDSSEEISDLREVLDAMESLSDIINSIKRWINKNPALKPYFTEDNK